MRTWHRSLGIGRRLVTLLLEETTDAEYGECLGTKLHGLVEELFDGRGVSRFRSLLVGAPCTRRGT